MPARPPASQRLLAIPLVTSRDSTRPQLLLLPSLRLRTTAQAIQEGADAYGNELSQEDDEGLFIPSYLEEVIPDDPVLQVKMARAMRAQEVETRRCFTCNQPGHLQRDHWKYEEKNGNEPLQPKGPP